MATRIKIEAIYVVPDDEVRTEADRLVQHLTGFRLACVGKNQRVPHHEILVVSAETKTWNPVD